MRVPCMGEMRDVLISWYFKQTPSIMQKAKQNKRKTQAKMEYRNTGINKDTGVRRILLLLHTTVPEVRALPHKLYQNI